MTYDQYVDAMTMALSGDPDTVAKVNRLLFAHLVAGADANRIPALALCDMKRRVEEIEISSQQVHRPLVVSRTRFQ